MTKTGTDVYVVQHIFHLDGPLDAPLLRAATQALLESPSQPACRFPPARYRSASRGDPPHVVLPWHECDLSGLDTPDAETHLTRRSCRGPRLPV